MQAQFTLRNNFRSVRTACKPLKIIEKIEKTPLFL